MTITDQPRDNGKFDFKIPTAPTLTLTHSSYVCDECGEAMRMDGSGISTHVTADGETDFEADADHVPYDTSACADCGAHVDGDELCGQCSQTVTSELNAMRASTEYSDYSGGSADYSPNFFYERVLGSNGPAVVDPEHLPLAQQIAVRNATQAINDAWRLEHHVDDQTTSVEAVVYQDAENLVVAIQHKDPTTSPYGSLVVFNGDGTQVAAYDDIADEFGELWTPTAGLRAQLLSDLTESSARGELGDNL